MKTGTILDDLNLETIQADAAELEKERDEIDRKLSALKLLEKALLIQRDGVPPKKPRTPKQKPVAEEKSQVRQDSNGLVKRIASLLESAPNGMACGDISHRLEITYATIYSALNKNVDMFEIDQKTKRWKNK